MRWKNISWKGNRPRKEERGLCFLENQWKHYSEKYLFWFYGSVHLHISSNCGRAAFRLQKDTAWEGRGGGGASLRVFFPCDLEKACPFIQVGVMKQAIASNTSFPFLIRRKLGPRQADFKLCIVKLQRGEPEATQTLQFRTPSCVWESDHLLQSVLSLCPPSLPGNHPKLFRCEG